MEDVLLLTRINDETVSEPRERAVATEIVGEHALGDIHAFGELREP